MFCFTSSNNNNEFIKYNADFELHLQSANTQTSHLIHIQRPQYDHWKVNTF